MINILTNKFGFEIANLTVITNKSVTVIPAQKQLYIKYWVWLYTWALIQSNYCKNLAKNLLSLTIIAHKWPQMQEPISPDFIKTEGSSDTFLGNCPPTPPLSSPEYP